MQTTLISYCCNAFDLDRQCIYYLLLRSGAILFSLFTEGVFKRYSRGLQCFSGWIERWNRDPLVNCTKLSVTFYAWPIIKCIYILCYYARLCITDDYFNGFEGSWTFNSNTFSNFSKNDWVTLCSSATTPKLEKEKNNDDWLQILILNLLLFCQKWEIERTDERHDFKYYRSHYLLDFILYSAEVKSSNALCWKQW